MAKNNSTITPTAENHPIDWLVSISDQLEAIERQQWKCFDEETCFTLSDICANAGGLIDKFLRDAVIKQPPGAGENKDESTRRQPPANKMNGPETTSIADSLYDDLVDFIGETKGIADLFIAASHNKGFEINSSTILHVAEGQYYRASTILKSLVDSAL